MLGDTVQEVIVRRSLFVLFLVATGLVACSSEPEPTVLAPPTLPSTAPSTAPVVSPSTEAPETTCTPGPGADCAEVDLSLADLGGADLRGANFRDADLYGSDLRNADLRGAELAGADLRNTDMSDANLTGALMKGAQMKDANLTRTDFTGSDAILSQFSKALRCKTVLPDGRKDDTNCPEEREKPVVPGQPSITRFAVPESLTCTGTDKTLVFQVRYSTLNAKTVTFELDGTLLPNDETFAPGEGRADLEYPCKQKLLEVTLVATDAGGDQASKTKTVRRA